MTEVVTKLQLAPSLSSTPPGRANPASPRASELAAMFCAEAGSPMKKELQSLQSEADDSPNEPEMNLNLDLQVNPFPQFRHDLRHPFITWLRNGTCVQRRESLAQ
jgi:hypothetical protein